MGMQNNWSGIDDFVFELQKKIGKIVDAEHFSEGVYRIYAEDDGCDCGTEYFVAFEDSPEISREAKQLGEHYQNMYLYRTADFYSGYKIIVYEAYSYLIRHHKALPDGETLREVAYFAAECHPEYFGEYPVPIYTPKGYMTRHRHLANGISWLETDQAEEMLAICFPIWDGRLSSFAVGLGEKVDTSDEMPYLFFSQEDSCVPLFELLKAYPKWEDTIIDRAALMHAIWMKYPQYAVSSNIVAQSGLEEKLFSKIFSMRFEISAEEKMRRIISFDPDADTDYFLWRNLLDEENNF